VAVFPEVFVESAEGAAAQGGNGIGALDAPMHPGAIQAGTENGFVFAQSCCT